MIERIFEESDPEGRAVDALTYLLTIVNELEKQDVVNIDAPSVDPSYKGDIKECIFIIEKYKDLLEEELAKTADSLIIRAKIYLAAGK